MVVPAKARLRGNDPDYMLSLMPDLTSHQFTG
jgi:hypothetical protein